MSFLALPHCNQALREELQHPTTPFVVQFLVIFVFQGLVVIIDDMDHAVDTKMTLLNSKILDV